MRMFQAVIAFGLATIVFALSHWLWLSLLALPQWARPIPVSVVIRFSLVRSLPRRTRCVAESAR